MLRTMKDAVDYSKYECPYAHLEIEGSHELRGPEGYVDPYGDWYFRECRVWCNCGFRGPHLYLDPDDLGLKKKGRGTQPTLGQHWCMCTEIAGVALDGFNTCQICGGKDAYGGSLERYGNERKSSPTRSERKGREIKIKE